MSAPIATGSYPHPDAAAPAAGEVQDPARFRQIEGREWIVTESREWIEAYLFRNPGDRVSWSTMLEQNAAFPPRLKWVLTENLDVQRRAEIFADESHDILRRCLETPAAPSAAPAHAAPPDAAAGDSEALSALCAEAGWKSQSRGGALVVPLEPGLPAGAAQLAVVDGGLRVFVELARTEVEPEMVREARELLLLRLGHHVRLVRPMRRLQEALLVTELETAFPATPPPEHLGHALSALTMAVRLSAAEFEGLGDEDLAGHYLATMRRAVPRAAA